MSDGIEFTDRYGGNYPDPATVCQGQCEGMGSYPQHRDDPTMTDYERAEWERCEAESPAMDGYHFIRCGECGGTGVRPAKGAAPQVEG